MAEATPQIKTLIKQETKRRRMDYVCLTCKEDQDRNSVTAHAADRTPPKVECLTCGRWFGRPAYLRLHMKTHLGIKNYPCEVCGKRFITRQKMSEHQNTHTGLAPVKCTMCDRTFRRFSNMIQHRDSHHLHKKPKIRNFACRQCAYGSAQQDGAPF